MPIFYLCGAAFFVLAFFIWNDWKAEKLLGKIKNERIDRKKLFRFIGALMVVQGCIFLWSAMTADPTLRSYQLFAILMIAAVEILAKRSSLFERRS